MPNEDPRKIIGNRVTTKAKSVTSDTECRRLYGSLWKSTTIPGTVSHIETTIQNGRRVTSITAIYDLSSRQKEVTLKIGKLCLVESSSLPGQLAGHNHTENPQLNLLNGYASTIEESVRHDQLEDITLTNHANNSISNSEIVANGASWRSNHSNEYINGNVPNHNFRVTGPGGEYITQRHCPSALRPIDYFMWMFLLDHLSDIASATTQVLISKNLAGTSVTEVLKFFGILILITRFEFSDRRSLWKVGSIWKYIPLPQLEKFMKRQRFENLRCNLKFNGPCLSDSSNDRWFPVRRFVDAINQHRASFVTPSKYLCIDESMSRWYGMSGDWIDLGLPHYVALERNPESGCELRTVADGMTGVMLRIEIVECADTMRDRDYEDRFERGTAVTLRLTGQWSHSDRTVCGDSSFASVETAVELYRKSLRFIGVVKTDTSKYPMRNLSSLVTSRQRDSLSLIHEVEDISAQILATMRIDRDRRYFVSMCGSPDASSSFERDRARMVNGESRNVTGKMRIPDVSCHYYSCCAQVDRHNRHRQDSLDLEKKVEVKEWEFRVNSTLLGMCIVDAYQLYIAGRARRVSMFPNTFFSALVDELIDNTYENRARRRESDDMEVTDNANLLAGGTGIHLQQSNGKRKLENGQTTNAVYQSRCVICKGTERCKFVCSECYNVTNRQVYVCHSGTGRLCFKEHVKQCHDVDIYVRNHYAK